MPDQEKIVMPGLGDTFNCAECGFTVITTIPCTCDGSCVKLECCGEPMKLVASPCPGKVQQE